MGFIESIIVCETFILTVVSILILFPLSYRVGLVDVPGGRKKHNNAVPLIGGIAIFISLIFLFLTFYFMSILSSPLSFFLLASFILVIVCIIDDKNPLSPTERFAAQALVILILIFFGKTQITTLGKMFGSDTFYLGYLAIPFTVFAIIGVINAVNMTDGIDGLTGSVSIAESLLLLFLAIKLHAQQETYLICGLIGSLLAFLIFNFPSFITKKYKIFLGDAGSMLLGFTLSWLSVSITQRADAIPPVLMLWVMALPIMDTIYLIINRKARGVSPFKSDRRHMHHILLMYFTNKQTVIILFLMSLIIGFLGIVMYLFGVSELNLFVWYLSLFAVYVFVSFIIRKKIVIRRKIGELI